MYVEKCKTNAPPIRGNLCGSPQRAMCMGEEEDAEVLDASKWEQLQETCFQAAVIASSLLDLLEFEIGVLGG